ncbi:MAG: hypothetical protein WDM78_13620 [Puia sp.]
MSATWSGRVNKTIGISVDAINGSKASIGGAYLASVISDFNANLSINRINVPDYNLKPSGFMEITFSNWYNPLAEYKYFLCPAYWFLLLTLIGGFMTALNIVREKEVGNH